MAWSIFSCLQNSLTLSDMKFVPASDTISTEAQILQTQS